MPLVSRWIASPQAGFQFSFFSLVLLLASAGCSSGNGVGTASSTPVTVKVTPQIQWATPPAIVAGTALGSAQLNAAANFPGTATAVAGTFTYSPAAGTFPVAGTQTLSTLFTPTDVTDYTTASATVSLVVKPLPPPSYTWQNAQIVGGGYVTGILMHPAQQGLMYARTDVGGAYRWNATTQLWTPLTDWVSRANVNLMGIESLAVDPSDPQRLYLAAGTYAESFGSNGAMLVSGDQGASFTTVPLPIKLGSNDSGRNAGERLQVDPNLGSTIYFGSRLNGLWRSVDRGSTWAQVAGLPVGPTSGVGVVFECFLKSSASSGGPTKTIYAGVSATGTGSDPQSLYVSNDAGTTWTAVSGAPTGLYVTHGVLGPDGNLYLTYDDQVGPSDVSTGVVYQYVLPTSSNPRGTWNNITPPRANGYQGGYGAVALDALVPGTIMVSTLDHYYPVGDDLWRSTNYGKTWYSIDTVGAVRSYGSSPWIAFGATSVPNTGNWVGSLQIDPYNSSHVVYGSGQSVWATTNMTASDGGAASNWSVAAQGIEETVVLGLVSPPSGPANLLSVMGDLGGFQHQTLTASPTNGAFSNPGFSTGTSIDFAQALPSYIARVGHGSNAQIGAYSVDYGATWTPFAKNPAAVVNGAGSIAVSSDGSTLVWSPSDAGAATSYSTNNGATWTACAGATAQVQVVADRLAPKNFYLYDPAGGVLQASNDGGATFTTQQTGLPKSGTLSATYDAAESLWLATGLGLYRGVKGGQLTVIGGVSSAWNLAAGAPMNGSPYLTLYLGGYLTGQSFGQLFRSTDNGTTWVRIDDAAHEFGSANTLQADPRLPGRVYVGTGGRGIVYGDSTY